MIDLGHSRKWPLWADAVEKLDNWIVVVCPIFELADRPCAFAALQPVMRRIFAVWASAWLVFLGFGPSLRS